MKEKAHTPASLTTALKEQAVREGFEAARITAPTIRPQNQAAMNAFIKAGHYGDMTWMQEKQDRRLAPQTLWPDVRSIIMLTMNYGPSANPLDALSAHENGVISVYAKGKDYHGIIKKKLKNLARWFVAETGAEVKVFVDTAPVMEKPLGETAGLGWQGKHTNLVSRQSGSWLFLGSIFTNYELPPDEPGENHCGNCRKCLDICPTKAFDGPYKLDARRCISYLTIEHQGHIPEELRLAMGNRVYGCDDCLAVCPWNKFAKTASEHRFAARSETDNPPLAALLQMDDAAFRQRFQGTPIKRTGRDRFLRNCLIAAGNSGQPGLLPHVRQLIDRQNEPALVRAAAIWAFRQLASAEEWEKLKNKEAAGEDDPAIKQEWAREKEHPPASKTERKQKIKIMQDTPPLSLFLGAGYTAKEMMRQAKTDPQFQGGQMIGTTRSGQNFANIEKTGAEPMIFEGKGHCPKLAEALSKAAYILISISPDGNGDIILQHFKDALIANKNLKWAGYLSTVGVYGNHDGAWVDEESETRPGSVRSTWRKLAEDQWLALYQQAGLPVHIFRLPGIYGPGRGPLNKLRGGRARRIEKKGQVFNRAHVEDIAAILLASASQPNPGAIYNVADDEPAPPQDVLAYGAELLGLPTPPLIPFETAQMSSMGKSFYLDNKRVSNKRIKEELGIKLKYPTYREGLKACL